ncbi:MAG: hypothetical protein JNK87_13080 [Bryobacterales bacterium]|nr:hypothetical protein [Bryobacterales bacterium]
MIDPGGRISQDEMEGQTVELKGPDFARSAGTILTQLAGARISELRIYPGAATAKVDDIAAAVNQLKPLFGTDAIVMLYDVQMLASLLLRASLGVKIGMPVGVAPPVAPMAILGPGPLIGGLLETLPGHVTASRHSLLSRVQTKIVTLQQKLKAKAAPQELWVRR